MGGGDGDEDKSSRAAPRESLKTRNTTNYSNWKHKLRENCCRRIRDDRNRLIWKMRRHPHNNNNNNEATFIQSALQDIVSDELTKINNHHDHDLLWEYDGLHSQPECEDILLEMQNIFYQDLHSTQLTSWEDEEDDYLAHAVFHHMHLNDDQVQKTVWCPICKQGELQENYSHVYCTACELRLLRGEEVTLELIRNRLAEAHAEHLDRGCKLTPKIRMESRFNLSVLYIECSGCDTFEVVI